MTQTQLWNFKEIDSTEYLNKVILSTLRSREVGPRNDVGGIKSYIRPGRVCGFYVVPNDPADNRVNLNKNNLDFSCACTNDGVLIFEDSDLSNALTFDDAETNDRVDLVVLKHSYSGALPNQFASYAIVKGTAASNPAPNYAGVAADEIILAEVYITGTGGPSAPAVITTSDIRVMPSAGNQITADFENPGKLSGPTDNQFGTSGAWFQAGRNRDRFYIMRDPDDNSRVAIVLNAYYNAYEITKYEDVASATASVTAADTLQDTAVDFGGKDVRPGDLLEVVTAADPLNQGTFEIEEIVTGNPDTIRIFGTFGGAFTGVTNYNIKSQAGHWYKEQINKQSVRILMDDQNNQTPFQIEKNQSGVDGSKPTGQFWEIPDAGAGIVPMAVGADIGRVWGCKLIYNSSSVLDVSAGAVNNNTRYCRRDSSVSLNTANNYDPQNIYLGGAQQFGMAPSDFSLGTYEVFGSGWWYVYATLDNQMAAANPGAWGLVLSQTQPDNYTLQHPGPINGIDYWNWRYIGVILNDSGIRPFRVTADDWCLWTYKSNETLIPYNPPLGTAFAFPSNSWAPLITSHVRVQTRIVIDESTDNLGTLIITVRDSVVGLWLALHQNTKSTSSGGFSTGQATQVADIYIPPSGVLYFDRSTVNQTGYVTGLGFNMEKNSPRL